MIGKEGMKCERSRTKSTAFGVKNGEREVKNEPRVSLYITTHSLLLSLTSPPCARISISPHLRVCVRGGGERERSPRRGSSHRYFPATYAGEVRGNSHGNRKTLFRLSGFSEGRPHGALGAALGRPGGKVAFRFAPGFARRERGPTWAEGWPIGAALPGWPGGPCPRGGGR